MRCANLEALRLRAQQFQPCPAYVVRLKSERAPRRDVDATPCWTTEILPWYWLEEVVFVRTGEFARLC
jgi:hypothetical protein